MELGRGDGAIAVPAGAALKAEFIWPAVIDGTFGSEASLIPGPWTRIVESDSVTGRDLMRVISHTTPRR
jgi:hypothetical protein